MPSTDKRSAPQAMAVSTNEQRRKTDGREYNTPPPIPCTPKELNALLDKWIADGIFKPNQFLGNPQRKSGRTLAFVLCITMCNILLQNVGRSAG